MRINLKSTIDYFSKKPKSLFLLDALGAALTTLFLFFVLRNYYHYFGMPPNILKYLSVIGLLYCTYSLSCYFFLKNTWSPYFRIIGVSNFLYCVLTMLFIFFYYKELTHLGLIYFLNEILIMLVLVYIELSVANRLMTRRTN